MPKRNFSDDNPVIAALRLFFLPLINKTSKLPAPLAYGSAVILAILVIILLGVAIPENLILLVGAIILACLAAFTFLDWDLRRSETKEKTRLAAIDQNRSAGTATVYVIVHRKGDETAYIKDAEVRFSLPDPQIRHTDTNGAAIFASIPSKYIGQGFPINATRDGYKARSPEKWIIQNDVPVYISLEPLSDSRAQSTKKSSRSKSVQSSSSNFASHKIQMSLIRPQTDFRRYESLTGLMSIGRNPQSTLALPEDATAVSWDHGVIIFISDTFYYRHVSETSATAIKRGPKEPKIIPKGHKKEYALKNYDRILIGNYEFEVTFDILGTQEITFVEGGILRNIGFRRGTKDPGLPPAVRKRRSK
jgi:hypothetical protein